MRKYHSRVSATGMKESCSDTNESWTAGKVVRHDARACFSSEKRAW